MAGKYICTAWQVGKRNTLCRLCGWIHFILFVYQFNTPQPHPHRYRYRDHDEGCGGGLEHYIIYVKQKFK